MCAHETVSLFAGPETSPFAAHPRTAPIAQLTDAYLKPSIREFAAKLEPAKQSFGNDPRYNKMLDMVRKWVLEEEVKTYFSGFKAVELAHAAAELASPPAEVYEVVLALIDDGRLAALIDAETGRITTEPWVEEASPFTQNLDVLLDGIERTLDELERTRKR
jgi:hypothetical protein